MKTNKSLIAFCTFVSLGALAGCSLVYGLGDYEVTATSVNVPDSATAADATTEAATPPECLTNQECTDRATAAGPVDAGADAAPRVLDGGVVPAVCVKATGKCASLLSEDCDSVYGDYKNNDAIVIASLLSTAGSPGKTNLPRQQSAQMAVEEINSSLGGGGIPSGTVGAPARPLVLVTCNAATDLTRAGTHLVDDLRVPAIVGPNLSQDTLDFTSKFSAKQTSVIISPAATAASIGSAQDANMTWCMPSSDAQRAKLTIRQINDIEAYLHGTPPGGPRNGSLRLAIVYRDDVLGQSTSASIYGGLLFNGRAISDAANVPYVKTFKYLASSVQTQTDTATMLAAFQPDVVALFGPSESVTNVLYPTEKMLESNSVPNRPYYAMIDPNKVKELTDGLGQAGVPSSGANDLRPRIRGVGAVTTPASAPVFAAFNTNYQDRWGTNPRIPGMSAAYDALYAFAYAMAATAKDPVSGPSIAKGLALLGTGTEILVGRSTTLKAFQLLGNGQAVNPLGSFGHLRWDSNGNIAEGLLDVWCVGTAGGVAAFATSTMTMDISTQQINGSYQPCN